MSLKHARIADASLVCPECQADDGISPDNEAEKPFNAINLWKCCHCKLYYISTLVLVMCSARPVSMRWVTMQADQVAAHMLCDDPFAIVTDDDLVALISDEWGGE